MKSPRQVRSDIRTLTTHIGQVRDALHKKVDVTVAEVGKECKRTSDVLAELLKSQELPENYKVAVVGRFKTGKSSFVNELLGARLASEDTNPETAAITTFRHGPSVKATVRFVSREEWVKLQALYVEDPKHIDAHRVKMWNSFGKPRKAKDGEEESFDLPSLERQFLKAGGHNIEIELDSDGTKKAETDFRRKLKEFTSGAKPHHCLVQTIDIESPAPILDEGVLLIDTPGLDDTERFRVSLTEKTVEDVDAILFLTKSGESYSQSDKDFLLSLLRKGTVKQLIVVITQVDVTYQQHLDNAEANDEDPEPLSLRIERERRRLAKELGATLAELSQDDSPAMRRYREQLGDVEVAFTSTKLHRNGKEGKPNLCAIDAADPGGVERLKSQLLRLLSTESRLAMAAQHIATGARNALLDLQTVLDTKLLAIRDIKDSEVAEQKLRNFRDEFGKASQRFEEALSKQVELLGERLEMRRKQHGTLVENIALLAERELTAFETNDVARHWRTRRSGYWGYMHDLQARIANRIFPKVQEMLGEYTQAFAEFARSFEVYLQALSRDGANISASLELGASLPFDVTVKLKESLERSLQRAQDLIAAEEQRVTSLLDDFVTDEVSERIDGARSKVSDIWGSGTTRNQASEVQVFYREVKQLLSQALMDHLRERGLTFGTFLVDEAKSAPRDALDEVQVLLEQAKDNIRAAAEALVAGQKGAIETLVANIKAEQQEVLTRAEQLLQYDVAPAEASNKVGDLPEPALAPIAVVNGDAPSAAPPLVPLTVVDGPHTQVAAGASTVDTGQSSAPTDGDWAESVQHEATVTVERLRLRDGATGWPFDKVFAARCLKGALKVRLVDPYLAKPHQIRNLNELLLHLAETAHPKEIEVVTGFAAEDFAARQDRVIDDAAKDLFKNYGVTLTLRRETGLHDRYLMLDHGVLFKLGRGLDIFKPAVGLAEHRTGNRRVRETDIDVFCRPGHPLAVRTEGSST
jgi:tRNA U34 5-carboxymethylaminomethyl modifying GTPase MnmE/TrmE